MKYGPLDRNFVTNILMFLHEATSALEGIQVTFNNGLLCKNYLKEQRGLS
jgi:hypothetical protein